MRETHWQERLLQRGFRAANRLYGRFIRLAERKRFHRALMEAPVELLPPSTVHDQARLPPDLGCSFRIEIASHSRSWRGRPDRTDLPEWALDNKLRAYRFAGRLGLEVPRVLQSGVAASDIVFLPHTVVKPEDGYQSYGVFLIDGDTRGTELKSHTEGLSPDRMAARMQELLATGKVETDRWHVEEILRGPHGDAAADVKFYSFYGTAPLALKIDRSGSAIRYQFVDRAGRPVSTDKYPQSDLSAIAVPEAAFALAERVSAEIPAPFMRLDFLCGERMVFGEVGNLIGGFARFGTEWDRRLGRAFVEARGRLHDDLRRGRRFEAFDAFLAEAMPSPAAASG